MAPALDVGGAGWRGVGVGVVPVMAVLVESMANGGEKDEAIAWGALLCVLLS
jgi:hypothetical protein